MRVILKNNNGFSWFSRNGVHIRGYFYKQGEFYENERMLNVLQDVSNPEEFENLINEINGYYAIIIKKDNFLLAATDRINSTPLFFTYKNEELVISDYAKSVISNDDLEDSTSKLEYLVLGYTTGNNTIYKNIKQLNPGEYLYYDLNKKSINLNRYYMYLHSDTTLLNSEEEYLEELKVVHERVFKRFVDSLNGKKVIVPLSGGYDSRLIVEMLKKYQYENVLCVTWGKKNDWQVKIARDVSKRLNYEWLRIDHSRKDWYDWFRSDDFRRVNNITGFISSIPYLQENITIDYLEKKYNIPKDSIFVSGNSGDFIEGEHIPQEIVNNDNLTLSEIMELIYKKNHRLVKFNNTEYETRMKDRIMNLILTDNNQLKINSEMAASIFENWEWQERQSKFVSKCVKAFESKDYKWRLPLWDNEIMDFWSRVPLKYRYGRRLFLEYSNKYMINNVIEANPKINKFKIYKERLFDNRYGCFNGNYNILRSLFIKDTEIFSKNIIEIIESKHISVHKLNGLIAIWNINNIKNYN